MQKKVKRNLYSVFIEELSQKHIKKGFKVFDDPHIPVVDCGVSPSVKIAFFTTCKIFSSKFCDSIITMRKRYFESNICEYSAHLYTNTNTKKYFCGPKHNIK